MAQARKRRKKSSKKDRPTLEQQLSKKVDAVNWFVKELDYLADSVRAVPEDDLDWSEIFSLAQDLANHAREAEIVLLKMRRRAGRAGNPSTARAEALVRKLSS